MTRTKLWLCMTSGGIAYNGIKIALGFEPTWSQLIDGAFWSGSTLLFHWAINRVATA